MTETKNNCGMHEALVAYLYGEASADEIALVQTHLTQCKSCTEELEAFDRVRGMLQQWELDDLPVVRVSVDPSHSSLLSLLKELLVVAPLWAKTAGAVAGVLLLLAVFGTDIKVGQGGVSFRADLLRRNSNAQSVSAPIEATDVERVRQELQTFVNDLVAKGEQKEQEALKARLVALESEWQTAHSADLNRLRTRIDEHQMKIRTLERDIDRHEGADLTDILFSGLTSKTADDSTAGGGR